MLLGLICLAPFVVAGILFYLVLAYMVVAFFAFTMGWIAPGHELLVGLAACIFCITAYGAYRSIHPAQPRKEYQIMQDFRNMWRSFV